jgi:hypothetical protein
MTVKVRRAQPLAWAPYATLYSGGQGYSGHQEADDIYYSPNRIN